MAALHPQTLEDRGGLLLLLLLLRVTTAADGAANRTEVVLAARQASRAHEPERRVASRHDALLPGVQPHAVRDRERHHGEHAAVHVH